MLSFFFQAEDGIRDADVTGVQTCALPICIGLGVEALECGAHWPLGHDATVALARTGGSPTALHNNCSGKHSGFLCTCVHRSEERRVGEECRLRWAAGDVIRQNV